MLLEHSHTHLANAKPPDQYVLKCMRDIEHFDIV